MATALVLGATGHIGSHVVRALLAEGHKVRAVYRNERFLNLLAGLPVERVRLDLDQPEGLAEAARGCQWVFHAAGYYPRGHVPRQEAIRRGETAVRTVLGELARARPERVVFTSSASTIRPRLDRPVSEEDPEPWPLVRGKDLYGAVKVAMEREALRAASEGVPVVVVNPSLCLGEYDAHAFSGRAVLAYARYRLPWYTDTWFNVVYTGDVGLGHVRAAERGRLGERYLLAGENVTLKEFSAWVCEELGRPPPRWRIPYPWTLVVASAVELLSWIRRSEPLFTRQQARRIRHGYRLDGSKARRELGMPQTPVREAVRRAVQWFRQEGLLR